ncbi:putative short-chain dehydrogenase [Botrytis cinerea]
MEGGTVLLTGANSSLAIPSIEYLLTKYANYTVVLTVRNPSDENTQRLREILSNFPEDRSTIHTLDLGSLAAVESFAGVIEADITAGRLPPLAAIICNAFTWSISDGLKFTSDNYESSMAVNHLAHLAIILRLLGSFRPDGVSPNLPEDLELLVHPAPDKSGEEVGRGFQRYGLSKAAAIMGMYQLNKRLSKDPSLSKISAVAMDPGGLTDSRCMSSGVPSAWWILMRGVLGPLQPLLRYLVPTLRNTKIAATDLIDISVGKSTVCQVATMLC